MTTQQIIKCDECDGQGYREAYVMLDTPAQPIVKQMTKCWKCEGHRRLVVCSCGCGATLPDNGCDETGRPMRG
jgi:hypothetical protein